MDLLENMSEIPWVKEETCAAVKDFFTAMRLPVPEKNEFTETNDCGFIVFLNPYGLAVRMTLHAVAPVTHPLVLQPLLRVAAGQYRIDVTPGIECPIEYDDADDLESCLHFDTASPHNAGYLPDTGIPVVLDPRGIFLLSKSVERTAALLSKHNYRDRVDPQEKLYGPLKKLFNEAWPGCNEKPEPAKLQNVWNKCRDMKEGGKLVTSWLKGEIFTTHNYKNAFTGSQLYAARLEASP